MTTKPKPKLARGQVTRFAAGSEAEDFEPGDFILTHANHWQSRLIRWAQGFRLRGADQPYAHWSHAAIIVGPGDRIVEAEARGVQYSHLARYRDVEYHLVRLGASATADDRAQAAAFAQSKVGQPFGFGTLASIAISLLLGGHLRLGHDAHEICSGLVARSLERTWAIFHDEPSEMLPGDLAKAYNVVPNTHTA